MSQSVDKRVVQMAFENAQFESGISQSLRSLDSLKKGLNFDGVKGSFSELNRAAGSVDLSPMADGVDQVSVRFNALHEVARRVIQNITDAAMNMGKKLVNDFTLEPVTAGFQEYETQINAIQTILSNTRTKGTTLDQVNAALAELNTYADKTIYNFTEMTRNIGTFTAAGVDLETSTAAIKGIANLAAASGSNAQQTATVMYQLSQALASGAVKYQDWISVNNAGIGGEMFKNSLLETAKVHGEAVDKIISGEVKFNETLKDGWITNNVLLETLQKFAGDLTEEQWIAKGYTAEQAKAIMELGEDASNAATKVKTFSQLIDTLKEAAGSGWTQSWEIMIGTFEEARETLTQVSDVLSDMIGRSAQARNELLTGWKELGGRDSAINAVKNIFTALMKIIDAVSGAFRDVFPAATAQQLYGITKAVENFTQALVLSDEAAAPLKSTLRGIFSAADIAVQAVGAIVSRIADLTAYLIPGLGKVSGGILGLTGSAGDAIYAFDQLVKSGDLFGKAVGVITNGIKKLIDFIKEGASAARHALAPLGETLAPVGEQIGSVFRSIGKSAESLGNEKLGGVDRFAENVQIKLAPVSQILDRIKGALQDFIQGVSPMIQTVGKLIGDTFSAVSGVIGRIAGNIREGLSSVDAGTLGDLIGGGLFGWYILTIRKFLKSFDKLAGEAGGIKETITDILDSVKGCFEGWQKSIQSGYITKIAVAIGILAASLIGLSSVDSDKLVVALGALTTAFIDLIGAFGVLSLIADSKNLKNVKSLSGILVGISAAVFILSKAMASLSGLSWDQLAVASAAIGVLTGVIGVFAGALVLFGNKSKDSAKNVKPFNITFNSFLKELGQSIKMTAAASALVLTAGAILMLAGAVKVLSGLDLNGLIQGVAAIGVLSTYLGILLKTLSGAQGRLISAGAAMILAAGAIRILVSAVRAFADMPFDLMAKGLIGTGAALAELVIAVKLLSGAGAMTAAIALTSVSAALRILAGSVEKFGALDWGTILRGLTGIGTSLLLVVAAIKLLSGAGAIKDAGGIAAVSAAIFLFVPAIAAVGSLPLKTVVQGVGGIAAALIALSLAAKLAGGSAPALLSISKSILAIGIGTLAAGVGLSAFAKDVEDIAASGERVASALKTLVSAVVGALVSSIGEILDGLGQIVTSTLDALITYAPAITDKIFSLLVIVIDGVAARVPELKGAIGGLLSALFGEADIAADAFSGDTILKITAAIGLLAGVFVALVAAGKFVKPAALSAALMIGVLTSVTAVFAVLSQIPIETTLKIAASLSIVLLSLSGSMAILSRIPVAGAVKAVEGLGIFVAGLTAILAALGGLNQIPGFSWLIGEGGNVLALIGTAIGGFAGGIIAGFSAAAVGTLPSIGASLSMFMTNAAVFIEGAGRIDSSVLSGILALSGAIAALGAANVIDAAASWITGRNSLITFGEELAVFAPYFRQYYTAIKGVDPSAVEASASAAGALAAFAGSIPNSGGLVSWFTGENSLSKFAEELSAFGPKLKAYADSVKGLDADVVIHSARAAEALCAMAENVPNSGGIAAWFAGDNTLSKFADELTRFGPSLKAYADSVRGLDTGAVTASISAAKILSAFSEGLPEHGGITAWLKGDNRLSTFAEELKTFAPSLKAYAESVSGVDAGAVTASISAAKILSAFAENLPNQGGIVSWFKGDNRLSVFGEELAAFGGSLKTYYEETAGINVRNMDAVLLQLSELSKLSGTDFQSFGEFIRSLQTLGNEGVTSFIQAFTNSKQKVKDAVDSVIKAATDKVQEKAGGFKEKGKGYIDQFIAGMKERKAALLNDTKSLLDSVASIFTEQANKYKTHGQVFITNLSGGMTEQKAKVSAAIREIMTSALNGANEYTAKFKDVGRNISNGLANGIKQQSSSVTTAATTTVKDAYNAAKKKMQIKSPSRKFAELGRYMSLGLAKGIEDYGGYAADASKSAADSALRAFNASIRDISAIVNSDLDTAPVIRPVLDLSEVENGRGALNRIFSAGTSLRVGSIDAERYSGSLRRTPEPAPAKTQPMDDSRIIAAVNRLGDRIDRLGAQAQGMRVVMDTGATVGQLESTIDRRLGVRAVHRERRL